MDLGGCGHFEWIRLGAGLREWTALRIGEESARSGPCACRDGEVVSR